MPTRLMASGAAEVRTRKNGGNTRVRGKPFTAGNPGRPKGARNRATVAAQEMMSGELEGVVRKLIDMAIGGDPVAIKLVLDRVVPPPRDRLIEFDLPPISSPADTGEACSAVVKAVSQGKVTPGEALTLVDMIERAGRLLEASGNSGMIATLLGTSLRQA